MKALGDLVIALTSLSGAHHKDLGPPRLLVARSQRDLVNAMGAPEPEVDYLSLGDRPVPALFDIKTAGAVSAMSSAVRLHRELRRTTTANAGLIFEGMGWRQSMVSIGRKARGLPTSPNIYASYKASLADLGYRSADRVAPVRASTNRVGIFPASRIDRKVIPTAVVRDLYSALRVAGHDVSIYLLDGECPDIAETGIPFARVNRTFADLTAAIAGCDRVISADSLPAHISERLGVRSFVLSPAPNEYWLPLSAYTDRSWALFEDSVTDRIVQFCEQ